MEQSTAVEKYHTNVMAHLTRMILDIFEPNLRNRNNSLASFKDRAQTAELCMITFLDSVFRKSDADIRILLPYIFSDSGEFSINLYKSRYDDLLSNVTSMMANHIVSEDNLNPLLVIGFTDAGSQATCLWLTRVKEKP